MERRGGYAVDLVDDGMKAGNDGIKERKNVTIRDEGKKSTSRLYEIKTRVLSIDLAELEHPALPRRSQLTNWVNFLSQKEVLL